MDNKNLLNSKYIKIKYNSKYEVYLLIFFNFIFNE